jgi:hypothetical protein
MSAFQSFISESTVIGRIGRALRRENPFLSLRRPRGEQSRNDLGDFYIVDRNRNTIEASPCDLEVLGRELGVLRANESVSEAASR